MRQEPWLVLDAESRLESVIAVAWCAAIAASPWLIGMFQIALQTEQIRFEGRRSSPGADLVALFSALVVMVSGGWQSIGIVAMVRELKVKRSQSLETA